MMPLLWRGERSVRGTVLAHRGTLFLDEVGDTQAEVQP
jgi:transcriptional regulator with GAF, ATPase, and Fis domain